MSETLNNNTEQAPSGGAGKTEYPPFDKQAAEEARAQKMAELKAEHPDLVEDIDKAHFMALAEDPNRTNAIKKRARQEHARKDVENAYLWATRLNAKGESAQRKMEEGSEALNRVEKLGNEAREQDAIATDRGKVAGELYDNLRKK